MADKQFDIAFTLRADVAAAKAGLADIKSELDRLHTASGAAAKGMGENAAAMGRATDTAKGLAAQAKQVEQTVIGLATSKPLSLDSVLGAGMQAAPRNITSAILQTTTAIEAAQKAATGAVVDMDGLGDALLYSADAAREKKQEMERLRAAFNPLFAESKRYEQQLEKIAAAEKLGALSASEAATERRRAATERTRAEAAIAAAQAKQVEQTVIGLAKSPPPIAGQCSGCRDAGGTAQHCIGNFANNHSN